MISTFVPARYIDRIRSDFGVPKNSKSHKESIKAAKSNRQRCFHYWNRLEKSLESDKIPLFKYSKEKFPPEIHTRFEIKFSCTKLRNFLKKIVREVGSLSDPSLLSKRVTNNSTCKASTSRKRMKKVY